MANLEERSRLSQALIELDIRIHSKLSFDEVMQSTLDGFVTALGADAGDIKLFAGGEWMVRYEHGFGPEVVGLRLDAPEIAVAERFMQMREPAVAEDFLAQPPEHYIGFARMHNLRALLAVPLVVRQEVIGCLFAWMRDTPRRFSSEEIDFGRRVAASVALALENARLFAAEQSARERAESAERELELELERTRVLLRASDELLTAADPDELLRRLASIVLDATGMTRVFVNLIDTRERVLIPKIATGGLAAPAGSVIPFEKLSETSRRAIDGGRPTVLDYERPDTPEADRAIASANAARVVLFVPLVHQGVVVGHISVDEPGKRYEFSAEQVRIVGSIAAQAAIALHNARQALEQVVDLLEQQLRWMAFGLHDGPMQTLTAAGAMLERAGRCEELEATRARTAAAEGLLDHALFEMRGIMSELRPVELEEESLLARVHEYSVAHEKQWGIEVELSVIGTETGVSRPVQVSLFRVVQEALTNTRKHANTLSVQVEIRYDPAVVQCTVRDNGCGFDEDQLDAPGATSHWGLASMRDRMLMVGGELEITSAPGEGTEVRARVPLETLGGAADERVQ